MKNYIYIFLAIVALSSCYHSQVIELSGERATREFSFNPTCESLSVFNTFDVILDESIPQGIAIIETDAPLRNLLVLISVFPQFTMWEIH